MKNGNKQEAMEHLEKNETLENWKTWQNWKNYENMKHLEKHKNGNKKDPLEKWTTCKNGKNMNKRKHMGTNWKTWKTGKHQTKNREINKNLSKQWENIDKMQIQENDYVFCKAGFIYLSFKYFTIRNGRRSHHISIAQWKCPWLLILPSYRFTYFQ